MSSEEQNSAVLQDGEPAVLVRDLVKHFRVHRREAGVGAGIKGLFRRKR